MFGEVGDAEAPDAEYVKHAVAAYFVALREGLFVIGAVQKTCLSCGRICGTDELTRAMSFCPN